MNANELENARQVLVNTVNEGLAPAQTPGFYILNIVTNELEGPFDEIADTFMTFQDRPVGDFFRLALLEFDGTNWYVMVPSETLMPVRSNPMNLDQAKQRAAEASEKAFKMLSPGGLAAGLERAQSYVNSMSNRMNHF